MLQGSIEAGRQGGDCALAAQADEIPAIGAENAAAGIQAFNAAGILRRGVESLEDADRTLGEVKDPVVNE